MEYAREKEEERPLNDIVWKVEATINSGGGAGKTEEVAIPRPHVYA